METIARTNVKLNDNTSDTQKKQIKNIFNNIYGSCNYVSKIDDVNYRGDMGCLCVLATEIYENLTKTNLLPYIVEYKVSSENTGYTEDMLDYE